MFSELGLVPSVLSALTDRIPRPSGLRGFSLWVLSAAWRDRRLPGGVRFGALLGLGEVAAMGELLVEVGRGRTNGDGEEDCAASLVRYGEYSTEERTKSGVP